MAGSHCREPLEQRRVTIERVTPTLVIEVDANAAMSGDMANALRAGFQRMAHRVCPAPVGSSDRVTRYRPLSADCSLGKCARAQIARRHHDGRRPYPRADIVPERPLTPALVFCKC